MLKECPRAFIRSLSTAGSCVFQVDDEQKRNHPGESKKLRLDAAREDHNTRGRYGSDDPLVEPSPRDTSPSTAQPRSRSIIVNLTVVFLGAPVGVSKSS